MCIRDRIYDADSNNRQVSCPYYFNWKRQGNDLIANLKIDTLGFLVNKTENIYLGIQTNNAGGAPYYGLDFNNNYHAPKIENIDKISLKIRAKICYTPKKDDIYRSGRIMYYFGWWNVEKQQRETISLDILHFWRPSGHKPGWVTEYVNTEAELSGKTADDSDYNIRKHTIYVNGKALGVIPESYDFYYDSTPNCSSSIDNATWLQIDIPVKGLIKRLLQEGFIDKEILEGAKYSGGILGGIEFWGRNLVELEVKDHAIYGKVCVGNNIDQTGNCNEVCGAASICNGMRPLDFIPFCDKGGNSAMHDRCSATCQPEDRLDNMCRKTGVSDCTGDAGCDKKTPGQCSENALKKCDSSCKEISSCGDGACNCGETETNCPADCAKSNQSPIGYFDGANCEKIVGWACDPDDYFKPISIHFYADGKAGGGGKIIGSTIANLTREAAVGSRCGGNNNHGFSFATPESLKDGKSHIIYAYAINTPVGQNPLLGTNGKTINCVPACTPKTCAALGNYQCGSWFDGCGKTINCGTCPSGQTCSAGKCVTNCTGRAAKKCDSGNLYWYNSCGQKEELVKNCTTEGKICSNGVCVSSSIIEPEPKKEMTRDEILTRIQEIRKMLIQLIIQLIAELQKQMAAAR